MDGLGLFRLLLRYRARRGVPAGQSTITSAKITFLLGLFSWPSAPHTHLYPMRMEVPSRCLDFTEDLDAGTRMPA
jgi:hypothetical protein